MKVSTCKCIPGYTYFLVVMNLEVNIADMSLEKCNDEKIMNYVSACIAKISFMT